MCFTLKIFLTYNKERLGLRFHGEEGRCARRDRSAARDVVESKSLAEKESREERSP